MPEQLSSSALPPELIERNKDKLNLRPSLEFVEQQLPIYNANIQTRLFSHPVPKEAQKWVAALEIRDAQLHQNFQISPERAKELLAHLPLPLLRVSHLKVLDYSRHAEVPVPQFDKEGNFNFRVDWTPLVEFPKQEQHPQRILIGYTPDQGQRIVVTPIPATISANSDAIGRYQDHVLLHEFFHTIQQPRQKQEKAEKFFLSMNPPRTYAEWRQEFFESLRTERQFTSNYAKFYEGGIYEGDQLKNDAVADSYQVTEQMAEAFVAYILDIISNPYGYTSFKNQSFGNPHAEQELLQGHGGQSIRHRLMREFFHANLKDA